MNILVMGAFYAEGFALHIAETLRAMGHVVARFEPSFRSNASGTRLGARVNQVRGVIHNATDSIPAVRARRMRALWSTLEGEAFDLVLVCHDFLWPEEVSELKRRSKAQVCLWFPDAAVNIAKGFFMNAPYDALFLKDPYLVNTFASVLRSPVYYLPECFNAERHRLPDGVKARPEYLCDITTAGNPHSWRVAFYRHLEGYDVKLWGPPPPLWLPLGPVAAMYQHRGVLDSDKARAFLGAKIVLNNLHYGEVWGVNARTFEVAGIGAFQMVDYRPGLSQLFDDGRELVSFRGLADCKQKLDYYLHHEGERIEIARAGQARAQRDHTYTQRLALLIATLEGHATGYRLPRIQYV